MSIQQANTASRRPMHEVVWDEEGSDNDWWGTDWLDNETEAEHELALDVDLWDAFEIDDDEPQPEHGDFWYEMDCESDDGE